MSITQGDNGVIYPFVVRKNGVVNLTNATVKVEILRNGVTISKDAVIVDALKGKAQVTLNSTDLIIAGVYTYQWIVTFLDGTILNGSPINFYVEENTGTLGVNNLQDQLNSMNTSISSKANQSDLNTTNANVNANAAALALKAAQTDLVTTNNNVAANTASLASKAQQTDLQTVFNYIAAKNTNVTPQRTHYYLYDSFARSNSTTDLGNCETNNNAYTYFSNNSTVWGITGNSAYAVSATGNGKGVAYQESYESDCVMEVNLKSLSDGNGVAFRITDSNNYWYLTIKPTYFSIGKLVAGSTTTLDTHSPVSESGLQYGDCKMSVLMKGNKIAVYLDGILISKIYDSFNSTATKHGFFSSGITFTSTWDNFCIKPVSDIKMNIQEGFETNLSAWYWKKETAGMSYSQTFSTSIKKSGTQSFRVELHKDDPLVSGSCRCEIYLPTENPLEEHWYGVSIYLPNGGVEDFADDNTREILIQWHNTPDSGESWTSPPLALMTGDGGQYIVLQESDEGRMSTNQIMSANGTVLNTHIGSYYGDKGKWVDWIFHVKWGWNSAQNPITEIYKNGQMVYQNNGVPNTTNDQIGIYPKLGIYKSPWHDDPQDSIITKRVVYYDDYWIR